MAEARSTPPAMYRQPPCHSMQCTRRLRGRVAKWRYTREEISTAQTFIRSCMVQTNNRVPPSVVEQLCSAAEAAIESTSTATGVCFLKVCKRCLRVIVFMCLQTCLRWSSKDKAYLGVKCKEAVFV